LNDKGIADPANGGSAAEIDAALAERPSVIG